jgi:hypothetical protein
MRTTSIIVIAALFYSTMGLNGSIKKRLGEVNKNALIQSECLPSGNATCGLEALIPPNLDFCTCSNSSGVLPPPGGSAELQVFQQSA